MSSDKYIHNQVENKIYKYWENKNLFKPKKNKKHFSIVIPPPNVTGSLHMGHALNNTIQDLLTRFHRMNNYETLWQPGTDHAGIATQALVEKKLAKENINKQDLGREKFINKVWEWKNEYGDIIINQLKKLGCSCDWSRNAFTMDENLSKSVIKVFVEMYNKGLIYKSRKLVNWDTVLKTAISDLEVDQREVNSKLYYIKYPIENSEDFITIATTRPEIMLGDSAVAVHPKDKRFKMYVGKNVILTNLEFRFPLIQYLQIGFPFPMTIGNILGHVFMDVGAAWDNSREFTNYSLLQAKYGNNLSDDFSPWVRTVGYGIKLPIFLPWRIEAAYDWTESGLSKPQWYISLGYDW